ncbi:MAG: ABC-F family ATP-binding cassette domain-containing protein [Rhizobiales bacterium]|nr:ABC-F family ATP-binding cassette domain-containing protein [Hyphomicrobiales bacterium]
MSSSHSPVLVACRDVSIATPDGRPLLSHLDITFGPERTGLVGRNGIGKSTLLKLIAGDGAPAAGRIIRGGTIGMLRQTVGADIGETVADLLGIAEDLARIDRLSAGLGTADDAAEADWTLEARVKDALAALGLPPLAPDRPTATLSGGQRTRLALAALLIAAPDMILLDEPTNNLDAEGRHAVANLLSGWRGGAIVVSHDRELLRGMDRIVELSSLGARIYGGGFDFYEAKRAEERDLAAHARDTAERALKATDARIQIARERKARRDARGERASARGDAPKILLDARRDRAEQSGGAASRLAERQRDTARQALAEAEAEVERLESLAVRLRPTGLAQRRIVLEMNGVGFAHADGRPILDAFDLTLTGPERVAVIGPNGAGKSTLLLLAAGLLAPTSGTIRRPVPLSMLDQSVALLGTEGTILSAFQRLNPASTPFEAHSALARFLFRNHDALKPLAAISGGERLRAGLAAVLGGTTPPQLLILDEPTNHLDLASIAAVEAALAEFDGALLVTSHDADFLDAIGVTRRIELGRGALGGAA